MADSKNQSSALRALRRQLGKMVRTDEETRFAASFDHLLISHEPSAVIRPESEDDIATVLQLANRYGIPVTARGSASATTGSATPVSGGWAIDLSGWRNIRIDAQAGMAHVQPGAVVEKIQQAAEDQGWFYPPDPSSARFCTIGGNLACNAGGLRGAKYGVTRDYVLALEGFLPTGERVRWGRPLRKFVAGYNLRDLWIGSEGTLGIITAASLRLIPKPAARRTMLAAFKTETQALRAVKAILNARVVPVIMEFLDRQTTGCVERAWGHSVLPGYDGAALLLIELDGHPAQVKEDAAVVKESLLDRALGIKVAKDEAWREKLWQARRNCSKAMFQLGDTKLNEDVVVPLDAYEKLLKFSLDLKKETGLATPTFGHVADGNFHFHIMYNRENREHKRLAEAALKKLFEKVIELGGAISGEHGIGLTKSPYLRSQHSEVEIDAMLAIKKALDPNQILNPDKIFTPTNVWQEEVLQIKRWWER